MAITKSIYKWQRVVMVRFSRCPNPRDPRVNSGLPRADAPEIDDRGYTGTDHSSIVGITQGNSITVRLVREDIEKRAQLFVKSSDTNVVTIVNPANGSLPSETHMAIQLHGLNGGNPRTAKIEVRFGSISGPIIHELVVWVFRPLRIRVTPHLVTIGQAGAGVAPIASGANINQIMIMARAIWLPAGVTLNVGTIENDNVTFTTAGIVSDDPFPHEVNTMLSTNWVPNTVNIYFVHRIGTNETLGYGISRRRATDWGLANPGIIIADTTAGGFVRDILSWANTIAHEIGHFFALSHVENQNADNPRDDTWSRRMLMYPLNMLTQMNNWKDQVGYGNLRRGCLITMKNLAQLTTDGECTTARRTITSAAGPY